MTRELTVLVRQRGRRGMIVSDHGMYANLAWSEEQRILWHCIAPGQPTQYDFIDSSNGRMAAELLNEALLFRFGHGRQKLAAWTIDYNTADRTRRSDTRLLRPMPPT